MGAMGLLQDGTYTCPPALNEPEACCFSDGTCELLRQYDCEIAGGEFYSGACDPNPCAGVPARNESWGSIKALFR